MKWYCKLNHPFEIGLYIDKTESEWIVKCHGCPYLHDGIRRFDITTGVES